MWNSLHKNKEVEFLQNKSYLEILRRSKIKEKIMLLNFLKQEIYIENLTRYLNVRDNNLYIEF